MTTIKLKDADRTEEIVAMIDSSFGSHRMTARFASNRSVAIVPDESRYSRHRIITVKIGPDREFRTIETWEKPLVPAENGGRGERYFYVDAAYSYRSDLIAYNVFGTPLYNWWVLYSNGMYDDSQLVPGKTLRIIAPPSERIDAVERRPF